MSIDTTNVFFRYRYHHVIQFSKAGELVLARRSNIKPKNVNILVSPITTWPDRFSIFLCGGGKIISAPTKNEKSDLESEDWKLITCDCYVLHYTKTPTHLQPLACLNSYTLHHCMGHLMRPLRLTLAIASYLS